MATLRHLIRLIRPFWLREKLFWKLRTLLGYAEPDDFGNITLEYAPIVSLGLKPTDVGHQQIAYLGYMERPLTELIQSLAIRGGFLVDVGANYGYFTCLWAAAKDTNRVVAFEASPRNLNALKANVERNNLCGSVTIVPNAAGRAAGRMRFSLGPESETGWGGLSLDKAEDQVEVDVISLSDYFSGNGTAPEIDVLKVDTEGADTWVLQGCEALLEAKRIRNVFFETNAERMATLGIEANEAVNLLAKHGYTLNRMGNEGWHAFV
jgi:FkbM family methyltransferase